MTTIDPTKTVCRVTGHLPAPDGRRMTIFCNADTEDEARACGIREGMATVESLRWYTPEQVREMDRKTGIVRGAE